MRVDEAESWDRDSRRRRNEGSEQVEFEFTAFVSSTLQPASLAFLQVPDARTAATAILSPLRCVEYDAGAMFVSHPEAAKPVFRLRVMRRTRRGLCGAKAIT